MEDVKANYTEQIKKLVSEGNRNQVKIANIVGCSVSEVSAVIRSNDLPYVKRNFLPKILELYKTSSLNIEQIADTLGCSVSYTRNIISMLKKVNG